MSNGRISLLVGIPGDGKSAVLEQTASALEDAGGTVLAFRLDRLGAFASTAELGEEKRLSGVLRPSTAMTSRRLERRRRLRSGLRTTPTKSPLSALKTGSHGLV